MRIADRQRPPPGQLYLDHVSHFVPDLDKTGALLEELGFAVTPLSVQVTQEGPAGTSNRCVMLADGYLEFLMPTADTPNARRLKKSMRRYRGVHLACFGTPAAEEEHQRLAAHGFAPQPIVHLKRRVERGLTARFSVVRAAPGKMPEGRVQYVQHLAPEAIWRPQHLRHRNGVLGLAAAYVVAANPVRAAARWARFMGGLPRREGKLISLQTDRGKILVGTRAQMKALLGAAPRSPAIAGYALACRDAKAVAKRCRNAGLKVNRHLAIVLPPALGGAWRLVPMEKR
ncbi:MAG: VOC family protein [Betaproteobacteria bacterium]|nr:VOC family protein [Betaproteobacteria bacterium]MDH4322518.1 VOC family protein [Betaproteobacteria bacterium]